MGRLQTAVTLPRRILLQGWALSSFGEDVNGTYTFQNTPSLGSQVTYLPDDQGDGIYAISFFGTSWVIREFGDATQEWRVITTNKALPLNNWVQVSSAGPAGTITILENISGKNNKISIKKTNAGVNSCGYQNISKLAEISGSDAPIGAVFNNIAFDYSSFASSCSSLGFNPTTISDSLGGVDFSHNYVVIRAKTSSTISADSISDLGDGIINITTVGPSSLVGSNYYRFFVMCKDGWNTVRFFGVDYPLNNSGGKISLYKTIV